MAISAPDLTTHLSTGAGRILFAEGVISHDGNPLSDAVFAALDGFVDLGEPTNITNTQEPGTETTYNSNRTQARATIFSDYAGQTRSIAVVSKSIIDDNFALWANGDYTTVVQSSGPVTDEAIFQVKTGRVYRVGSTASNPLGVRGASSITINNQSGSPAAWVSATDYSTGAEVSDGVTGTFIATTNGTSGGSAPSWAGAAAIGDTVTDNGIVWKRNSTTSTTFTVAVDYQIEDNTTEGLMFKWLNSTDLTAVFIDYTTDAVSYKKLVLRDKIIREGRALFFADWSNQKGIAYAPSVSLIGDGNTEWITDADTFQEFSYSMTLRAAGSLKPLEWLPGIPV